MYKISDKQMSITDFGMPLGMKLNPDNRWVKKAGTVPWDEIETKYAALFKSINGNVAKPLRLALGALIIQTEYGYSDVEITLQIQEAPYLQYFCGYPEYKDEPPFDSSLMVHFRKRLTPEIMGEINELIIAKAKSSKPVIRKEDDLDDGNKPNRGTLIVDATCAPQNIKHPQDLSLLNETREGLEKLIDELHEPKDGVKPRTYRKKARRDFLRAAKQRNLSNKELKKAKGKQLGYIERNTGHIEAYIRQGKQLSPGQAEKFLNFKSIYWQQSMMCISNTNKISDRIVSVSQPWVRPIVRGKAKHNCEFGAKLDISVFEGFVRLEHSSFDPYNESENLMEIIRRHKQRTGSYPQTVLVDQVFRTKENREFCEKHNIQMFGKPLGKNTHSDKKNDRQAEIDRIEVERKISHAKSSYGLNLIRSKLKETSKTAIALSLLCLNIHKAVRLLFILFSKTLNFFKIHLSAWFVITQNQKMRSVQ
jgi:hypothetical protein